MATLILPRSLRSQIQDAARTAFPHECCGLIEGKRLGDAIHAVALHSARNLATDADRFEIDPADHFTALREARANGTEILGCYHSHPNGVANVSDHDQEGALDDRFVWLICALKGQETQIVGFLRENGSFGALELRETPHA